MQRGAGKAVVSSLQKLSSGGYCYPYCQPTKELFRKLPTAPDRESKSTWLCWPSMMWVAIKWENEGGDGGDSWSAETSSDPKRVCSHPWASAADHFRRPSLTLSFPCDAMWGSNPRGPFPTELTWPKSTESPLLIHMNMKKCGALIAHDVVQPRDSHYQHVNMVQWPSNMWQDDPVA